MRTVLYKINETDSVLLVLLHHIICDGWCSKIFAEDLLSSMRHLVNPKKTPLPQESSYQYSDFCMWQRSVLTGAKLENLLTYWKGQLEGYTDIVLDLPTNVTRPRNQTWSGARKEFIIPEHRY
jgi:hypothetical protein